MKSDNEIISAEYFKDKLAELTKVCDIENNISLEFGDLIISTAREEHVSELAELWANHATIQQIHAPERYDFHLAGKDWQKIVRQKMAKKHNLVLVVTTKGDAEVKAFMYLQTITIPSSDLLLKGFIEDLYTKPQHRRKGIAHKMLEVAMCWSKLHGIKQVELCSLSISNDITNFYNSFVEAHERDVELELIPLK